MLFIDLVDQEVVFGVIVYFQQVFVVFCICSGGVCLVGGG